MEKLYKKLDSYGQSDYYPFHMPGHKRNPDSVRGDFPFERDITEIEVLIILIIRKTFFLRRRKMSQSFMEQKKVITV